MIQPLINVQANTLLKEIQGSSKLSTGQKTYFASLVQRAAEATNGVSQEEKIQSCSELSFAIVAMLISKELKEDRDCKEDKDTKKYSWYEKILDTIVVCKTHITIIVLGALALCYFHPQVADVIAKMFN